MMADLRVCGTPARSLGSERTVAYGAPRSLAVEFFGRSRRTSSIASSRSLVTSATTAAVYLGSTFVLASRVKQQNRGGLSLWRRRRAPARWRIAVAVADETGHFEKQISRIGPPVSPDELAAAVAEEGEFAAKWRLGAGSLRVAYHADDSVTAMACYGETMCIGTHSGLVRTIDIESGSVVGDYYLGKHSPLSAISSLYFDGVAVAAGDADGKIYVWRAELPGSWGFTHSPQWVLAGSDGSAAHAGTVTGLSLTSSGLVSSDDTGRIVFWQALRDERSVAPAHVIETGCAVHCLCADREGNVVYAGSDDGVVQAAVGEEARPPSVQTFQLVGKDSSEDDAADRGPVGATAVTWDAASRELVVGCKDGRILRWKDGSYVQPAFDSSPFLHKASAVRSLDATVPGFVISSAADECGRVIVWDKSSGKAFWGLQGVDSDRLVAVGNGHRLVASGLRIVNTRPTSWRAPTRDWREPSLGHFQRAGFGQEDWPTPCEAILCLDFADVARSDSAIVEMHAEMR